MSKRLVVYLKNSGNIGRSFRPDKKGIHPVLLGGRADKGDVRLSTCINKCVLKKPTEIVSRGLILDHQRV
jgi:hypothetical protein